MKKHNAKGRKHLTDILSPCLNPSVFDSRKFMVTYTANEEDKLEAKRLAKKKYDADYYQKNKDKRLVQTKAYYWTNRGWYIQYMRNYYQEHKEEAKLYSRLYYIKNKWKRKIKYNLKKIKGWFLRWLKY